MMAKMRKAVLFLMEEPTRGTMNSSTDPRCISAAKHHHKRAVPTGMTRINCISESATVGLARIVAIVGGDDDDRAIFNVDTRANMRRSLEY